MYNPFSLSGKTILVTGASSGIGRATALECSKLGAKVVITGKNEERLNETWNQLEGTGHLKFPADLAKEEEIIKLTEQLPVLNGVVNAAGIVKTLPFSFLNKKELSEILDVNFTAPITLTQKLVKAKKIEKSGSVVFLSSIDGPVIAHAGNSMYAASKGALSAMAKTLALELAPKGIRVNCILPGMTETSMIQSDNFTKEQHEEDMKKYPLKRYGKPEEIAYAAVYLLSDASSWTTGAQLIIDGGFTIL